MKSGNKYVVHIVWLVIAIVALVGGYFYGKSTVSSVAGRFGGRGLSSSTFAGRTGGATGGGFVAGTVVSMSSDNMTIQLANGNTQIVFYSSSTAVIKPEPASVSDLTTGTMVMIGGTENSDGSLTAASIQVRTGAGPGGFGGAPSSTTQAPNQPASGQY